MLRLRCGRSELRPMTFSDGNGRQAVLHAGDVHFPAEAFAPDAHVVLSLQPRERGTSNADLIEFVFEADLLRALK